MGAGTLTVRDDTPLLADDFAEAALVRPHPIESSDDTVASEGSSAPLRGREHPFKNHSFFAAKTLSELADEQGVRPVKDISVFAGGFPEDEDLDELLAELDQVRES